MDDGLIREIREAEQTASDLVREANQRVDSILDGIEKEYARLRENWKAEYPLLLKAALSDAEKQAALITEKKTREAGEERNRIKENAANSRIHARSFLLEKLTGTLHGNQ